MKEFFMNKAIEQACNALELDEVPVGAIIVRGDQIISTGHNLKETSKDPTAHAEIIALRKASEVLGGWRLSDCDMYVTLEPCAMCCGAIIQARIRKLYIGAMDPKGGAAGSKLNLLTDYGFNHKCEIEAGLLEQECSQILKNFFKHKRA
ncbi:MAG: tRNA-specific adenosine deaminase [Clostridiales bacterium GWB2_37_7]|nr:MAG: tRNA-specific adenosine deaminase [Clostridiales bacterium GWB2_37_7]